MEECEYCDIEKNTEVYLEGSDGIVFNKKKNEYYIFIEYFRNECIRIRDIKYCPMCGKQL